MSFCSKYSRETSLRLYQEVLRSKDFEASKLLCQTDLFYLLVIVFKRFDVINDWLYERCREVEAEPNGYLDLWAREHYKSTIITYAKTIQDILCNPEITVGIFSHTRPNAKSFLEQIKRELEDNQYLKSLFPEVLYEDPQKQSSKWSLDNGIIVKRASNPKEATVEAWGIVDGQPTGKHFSLMVYDDVVTKESVSTPDMIHKVTDSWALSLNLTAKRGNIRYIGTRYRFNDTYKAIIDRGAAVPRVKPATENGEVHGKPVFLSEEELIEKRKNMGPYVFGSQMLQNPIADAAMGFKQDWLLYYTSLKNGNGWNYYVLCDPASGKKKNNDYTVIVCIALAPDNNYYLMDAIRDRLNLTERCEKLFGFVRKWNPIKVGYEKYGMQSDIEHIKYEMENQNYRFKITALGGNISKEDRIRKLIPLFEQGRFYMPRRLLFSDYEGKAHDFIQEFIENEFSAFPVAVHDDMLDCVSRIVDNELGSFFPEKITWDGLTEDEERVETDYDLFD